MLINVPFQQTPLISKLSYNFHLKISYHISHLTAYLINANSRGCREFSEIQIGTCRPLWSSAEPSQKFKGWLNIPKFTYWLTAG